MAMGSTGDCLAHNGWNRADSLRSGDALHDLTAHTNSRRHSQWPVEVTHLTLCSDYIGPGLQSPSGEAPPAAAPQEVYTLHP